jgi:hypothetical protein
MRRSCAAALMILLLAPGTAWAAEGEADALHRTRLGEFVPASQPAPAPAIPFTDSTGNEGAAEWDSPEILRVIEPFLAGDGIVKASSR